jgi:hypothetical protein
MGEQLNGPWHKLVLNIFLIVVLAHWAEHVLQAIQIWVLGMPRPDSLGALGYLFPWLVESEALHYFYAIFMLAGFAALLPAFKGEARLFWWAALLIQFWHHIEHFVLLIQSVSGYYWFGQPVPVSFVQLVVPRAELHLFYNAIVFVPMVIAMYFHMYPIRPSSVSHSCSCSRRSFQMGAAH